MPDKRSSVIGRDATTGTQEAFLANHRDRAATHAQVVTASGMADRVSAAVTRPADTTLYATGDVVGASPAAALTFADVVKYVGGTATVLAAMVVDSANQSTKLQCELWLFSALPTLQADNAAFAPSDADLGNLVCAPITIGNSYVGDATSGAGGNAILASDQVNRLVKCGAAETSLYGVLVARNGYTPVASEVFTVKLAVYQD